MSNNYEIELISRLKQQPRHGQGISPITQVQDALNKLFQSYKVGGDEIVRLNIFGQIANQINQVVSDLTVLQDLNQGLSEDFNINSNEAAKLGVAFDQMGKSMNINMQKAKKYAGETRDIVGTNVKFYTQQKDLAKLVVKQNDDLRNKISLTEEANKNLLLYGLSSADFYKKSFKASAEGLAIITSGSSADILNFVTSSAVTCSFSSSLTIYETQYKCTIRSNEFNATLNPSAEVSGSILSYSGSYFYQPNGGIPTDNVTGSYFAPYVSTVGLYDEDQNLLAVGKLAQWYLEKPERITMINSRPTIEGYFEYNDELMKFIEQLEIKNYE